MTNSEWLRTLSDETLARLISGDWCEILNCGENNGCERDCEKRALEWLKEEVRGMIVNRDGYAINYEPEQNRITILMPPTAETRRDTVSQIAERKTELSGEELQLLLDMAKYICRGGNE
jgi:hypothetical protein